MIHLVLFEPEIPPNTGNLIRLVANTGMHLHLIEPLGFSLEEKQLRRSGLDYHDLAQVSTWKNLDAFLSEGPCQRLWIIETGGKLRYDQVDYAPGGTDLWTRDPRTQSRANRSDRSAGRLTAHGAGQSLA